MANNLHGRHLVPRHPKFETIFKNGWHRRIDSGNHLITWRMWKKLNGQVFQVEVYIGERDVQRFGVRFVAQRLMRARAYFRSKK